MWAHAHKPMQSRRELAQNSATPTHMFANQCNANEDLCSIMQYQYTLMQNSANQFKFAHNMAEPIRTSATPKKLMWTKQNVVTVQACEKECRANAGLCKRVPMPMQQPRKPIQTNANPMLTYAKGCNAIANLCKGVQHQCKPVQHQWKPRHTNAKPSQRIPVQACARQCKPMQRRRGASKTRAVCPGGPIPHL